jgi:hypothetical protein
MAGYSHQQQNGPQLLPKCTEQNPGHISCVTDVNTYSINGGGCWWQEVEGKTRNMPLPPDCQKRKVVEEGNMLKIKSRHFKLFFYHDYIKAFISKKKIKLSP